MNEMVEASGVSNEANFEREDAAAAGVDTAESRELATPRRDAVSSAAIEAGQATRARENAENEHGAAQTLLTDRKQARDRFAAMGAERTRLATERDNAFAEWERVDSSKGADSVEATQAFERYEAARTAYESSEDVKTIDAADASARESGFENKMGQMNHLVDEAQTEVASKQEALTAAQGREATAKAKHQEALGMKAETAADKHFEAYQNYSAAFETYQTAVAGGDEEQIAAAKEGFTKARDDLHSANDNVRRVSATVSIQTAQKRGESGVMTGASSNASNAGTTQKGAPTTEVDVRVQRQSARGGNRTSRPTNTHLGSTIASASSNGGRSAAGRTIIRSVDQGQISAELGEVAMMAFADKDGQQYAGGRTLDSAMDVVPDNLTDMLSEEELTRAMQDISTLPQSPEMKARGIDSLDKYRSDLKGRYESASKGYEAAMARARESMNTYKSSGGTNTDALEAVKKAIAEAITHSANFNSIKVEINKDK